MGLTIWRKAPAGKIYASDVSVAKNYLNSEEIQNLNRIVNLYLDFTKLQASRGRLMKMKDWIERLDAFLRFSEFDILHNAGKVSAEVAKALAMQEYEKYRPIQDREYLSNYDRETAQLKELAAERENEKNRMKELPNREAPPFYNVGSCRPVRSMGRDEAGPS